MNMTLFFSTINRNLMQSFTRFDFNTCHMNYLYSKVIWCLSVCLSFNNSKTGEPIGLKLIACLLLGPRMVLGFKKSGSGYRFAEKPEKNRFSMVFHKWSFALFLKLYREYLGSWEGRSPIQPPTPLNASGEVR